MAVNMGFNKMRSERNLRCPACLGTFRPDPARQNPSDCPACRAPGEPCGGFETKDLPGGFPEARDGYSLD